MKLFCSKFSISTFEKGLSLNYLMSVIHFNKKFQSKSFNRISMEREWICEELQQRQLKQN